MPRDGGNELSPRSGVLLAAYFDLRTDEGPLHARSVADVGRRFLAGQPIGRPGTTNLMKLHRIGDG